MTRYQKNKEYYKQKAKEWRAKNPEKLKLARNRAQQKARSLQSKQQRKEIALKQDYKLFWKDYIVLFSSQSGKCKICKRELALITEGRGGGTANVDHCHSTGNIRGLLCNSCNRGLGCFKDSSTFLRLAAEYIDESTRNIN